MTTGARDNVGLTDILTGDGGHPRRHGGAAPVCRTPQPHHHQPRAQRPRQEAPPVLWGQSSFCAAVPAETGIRGGLLLELLNDFCDTYQ